jgi:hypothetical protein
MKNYIKLIEQVRVTSVYKTTVSSGVIDAFYKRHVSIIIDFYCYFAGTGREQSPQPSI